MITTELSRPAAQLLRELVTEARHDIRSGVVSYGTPERNADALENLDELDTLACEAMAKVPA